MIAAYVITLAAIAAALFISATVDGKRNRREGRTWSAMGPVEDRRGGRR